jgi:peptidoglycan/LPS O-acetylase OafA/YrhL
VGPKSIVCIFKAGGEMAGARIRWMDGLRGVAIFAVIIFHLYGAQFASFVPYGDRYSHFYLVRYGWTGVELFFLISGFVILMTLERSRNLLDFARKRWLRLFPAMLVASLVSLTYDRIVGVGPETSRAAIDLIPGLTFLSPAFIHAIAGVQLSSMDGPYWSLYVEVVFYAAFGTAYSLRGWKSAVGTIICLFAITYLLDHAGLAPASRIGRIAAAMDWLGLNYFGWFGAGALYYKAATSSSGELFCLATGVAIAAACTQRIYGGAMMPAVIACLVVAALFAAAQRSMLLQRMLSTPALVFVGFISYPLYLLHSNITIGLTHVLGGFGFRSPFLPFAPLAVVAALAWVIAKYVEPALRRLFRPQGAALRQQSAIAESPPV